MEKVDRAVIVVAIVGHRYGWVPPDQPVPGEKKGITWLECERARELLVFVVDENAPWPEDQREDRRLSLAMRSGNATAELFGEVQERVQRLKAFKSWLNAKVVRATFTDPSDLKAKISEAFLARKRKNAELAPERPRINLELEALRFQFRMKDATVNQEDLLDCITDLEDPEGRT